jgi:hypothetical protein
MQITYRYRIKDKHAARLAAQARAVDFVWNYCNETQMKAAKDGRRWLSGYDLWKLVAGCTKEGLDLHAHTAMRVCIEYDKSRRQHRTPWLRWRKSKGSGRSLGWCRSTPGTYGSATADLSFARNVMMSGSHRPLPEGAKIGAGSFSQDSKGHWYINCPLAFRSCCHPTASPTL